jgi:hypothetical protein
MATVLEECTAEEQRPVVRFCGQNRLNAKNINKEMFRVYGGKWFSRTAVHNWMMKFSQEHPIVVCDA